MMAKRIRTAVAAGVLLALSHVLASQAIGAQQAGAVPAPAPSPSPAATAPAPAPAEKQPSAYILCDGYPNNMTAGETTARLIGIVALVGLLAPPPESADTSKRKFGAEGVAVCDTLIDDPKLKEGNSERRLGLILARAVHRIEAKDYDGARADVALAREEARAQGLMANPYFMRSRGRSFDELDAAIMFRMGRIGEAGELAIRSAVDAPHSVLAMTTRSNYDFALPTATETELDLLARMGRGGPSLAGRAAQRFEELGRFADAVRLRAALFDVARSSPTEPDATPFSSHALANLALAMALAGDGEGAAKRMAEARANFEKRKAEGKPEENGAAFVEASDLYAVIAAADAGDLATARRLFAARSEWLEASFGCVLAVTRRLRVGAKPEELIGGLARSAEQLWEARAEARKAALLAKDSDNKTLFWLIDPLTPASSYESQSKTVWRTDKSRMLIKVDAAKAKSKLETLALFGSGIGVTMDAYMMHAALLARSRGHKGFMLMPIVSERYVVAAIRTGNAGEPGLAEAIFNDAEQVIADLSPFFPDPETLKARRAAKR